MVDNVWEVWWARHKHFVAWVLGATLIVLMGIAYARHPVKPRASRPFGIIGFYENYSSGKGSPSSLSVLTGHVQQLTMVSPQWFRVNMDGSVTDTGYDPAVANMARAHHVALAPLFINASGRSQVLLNAAARMHAVQTIVQIVNRYHLDGVDIDFELLRPGARTGLSLFIQELAAKLRPLHKTTGVCVFPLVGLAHSVNAADDYRALAHGADYLVMMTYDHHYSGGVPGPVAPFDWVKANVKAALRQVPASRIVLGIGMYGYDWIDNGKPGSATTVPHEAVPALLIRYGVQAHYDPVNSQNWFTYFQGGVKHIVYYMGTRSAQARVEMARRYHLGGVSLWRLGFEDPGFWSVLPGK